MVSTDRDEFDKQLAVLFAAFPAAYFTDARKEAYWRGLKSMSLPLFTRVVDRVLGQSGDEQPPSVSRVWEISRDLMSHAPGSLRPTIAGKPINFDEPALSQPRRKANITLLRWIVAYNGPSIPDWQMRALVAAKDKLMDEFEHIMTEDEVSELEIREALNAAFDRVISTPQLQHEDHVCD